MRDDEDDTTPDELASIELLPLTAPDDDPRPLLPVSVDDAPLSDDTALVPEEPPIALEATVLDELPGISDEAWPLLDAISVEDALPELLELDEVESEPAPLQADMTTENRARQERAFRRMVCSRGRGTPRTLDTSRMTQQ